MPPRAIRPGRESLIFSDPLARFSRPGRGLVPSTRSIVVPVATTEQASGPSGVSELGQTLSELRGGWQGVQGLVDDLFGELTQLRLQAEEVAARDQRRREQYEALREQLDQSRQERGRIAHQLEQTEAELSDAREEIDELERVRQRQNAEANERQTVWQRKLDALGKERDDLRRKLEQTLDALSEAKSAAAPGRGRDGVLPRSEADEELQQLREERDELVGELELVRSRTAELSEAYTREQQQSAAERAEWSQEIKELRQLLQQPSGQAAEEDPRANRSRPAPPPREPRDESFGGHDAVIDSVMAQFSKVQQDASRRRRRKQASEE